MPMIKNIWDFKDISVLYYNDSFYTKKTNYYNNNKNYKYNKNLLF